VQRLVISRMQRAEYRQKLTEGQEVNAQAPGTSPGETAESEKEAEPAAA